MLPSTKILLALLICLGSALACHFVESMGGLSEDNSPVIFIAKGETVQIWRVSVRAGTTYEVDVVGQEVTGQYDGASIIVCSQPADVCSENSILSSVSTLSGGARLTFTAPANSETVYLHIIASIGEDGQELGTFSVSIREIQ